MDQHDMPGAVERKWGESIGSLRAAGCPEAVELVRLAERRAGGRAAQLLDHVAGCPACRRAYRELLALERARPTLAERLWPVRSVSWQGAAAATAAATVLLVGFWSMREPMPPVDPSKVAQAPEAGMAAPGAAGERQDVRGQVTAPRPLAPDSTPAAPAAGPAPKAASRIAPPAPGPGKPARGDVRAAGEPAPEREPKRRGAGEEQRLAYAPPGGHAADRVAGGLAPSAAPGAQGLSFRDGAVTENGLAVPVLTREEAERAAAELDGAASMGLTAASPGGRAALAGPGAPADGQRTFGGGFGGYGDPAAQGEIAATPNEAVGAQKSVGNTRERTMGRGGAAAGAQARQGVQAGQQARVVDPDPANAALMEERPTFRVQRAAEGPEPAIALLELNRANNTQAVVQMRTSFDAKRSQTVARPTRPLDPRSTYTLQVMPGGTDAARATQQAQSNMVFSYQLLGKADQERVRWALSNRAAAPVSSALVFYSLGRYADALEALRSAPDDDRVRGWRSRLSRLVAERRGDTRAAADAAPAPPPAGAAGRAAPGR